VPTGEEFTAPPPEICEGQRVIHAQAIRLAPLRERFVAPEEHALRQRVDTGPYASTFHVETRIAGREVERKKTIARFNAQPIGRRLRNRRCMKAMGHRPSRPTTEASGTVEKRS